MNKSLFEELTEFTDELVLLLKQDWEKTKKFIREHKNYFLWVCALFIGAQFTDIMTLGKSWDNYCKKNGIQNGGAMGNSAGSSAILTKFTNNLKNKDSEKKDTEEKKKETDEKDEKKDDKSKKKK